MSLNQTFLLFFLFVASCSSDGNRVPEEYQGFYMSQFLFTVISDESSLTPSNCNLLFSEDMYSYAVPGFDVYESGKIYGTKVDPKYPDQNELVGRLSLDSKINLYGEFADPKTPSHTHYVKFSKNEERVQLDFLPLSENYNEWDTFLKLSPEEYESFDSILQSTCANK